MIYENFKNMDHIMKRIPIGKLDGLALLIIMEEKKQSQDLSKFYIY